MKQQEKNMKQHGENMKQHEKVKNYKKKTLPDWLFLLLSFLLPCVLFGAIWKGMGISYNGNVTPLIYDVQEQFLPLFASLRYIVDGENSLFYSWGMALGGNHLGTIAYYVASPLSWITVFFGLEDLPNAIYLLTILKIGLCGLAFALYVRFGLLKKQCGFVNLMLVCCYALMSYNVIYSGFLMWIDGVIFLPLILLGIEKIIEGKKGFLYFGAILLLFISSYYMSYIVGIFAAVYILCRVFGDAKEHGIKEKVGICIRFAVSTLLAMGLAAPVLVSAVKSVLGGRVLYEKESSLRLLYAYNFGVFELLKKLLPTQYDGVDNSALPSVYCGSMALGLAVFYFCRKDFKKKEKLSWLVLLLVSFVGFLVPQIDFVWHVFQYPNSFPYRYAFLFSAVVIILANCVWEKINCKTDLLKMLTVIGVFYTILELYFNGSVLMSSMGRELIFTVKSEYELFLEQHSSLVERVKKEKEFYRTEFDNDFIIDNSAYFFGVNGVSSFVSTFNGKVNDFLCDIGGEKYAFFTTAKELTPLGDSLLGVKYRIEDSADDIPGYELVQESVNSGPKMSLFENGNALSLGYMVDEVIVEGVEMTSDPYANQNNILKAFGVTDYEVFAPIGYNTYQEDDKTYIEFEVPSKQDIYFYMVGNKNWVQMDETTGEAKVWERSAAAYLEGLEENPFSVLPLTNYYLGSFETGDKITLVISNEALEVDDFYLYSMDMEKCDKALGELKESQLAVENYKGGNVVGKVTVPREGQVLFTTIPTDGGHTVKVDGFACESMVVLDTFLAIPLSEGEHSIEIQYITPGFKLGMWISVLAIIGSVCYFIKKK